MILLLKVLTYFFIIIYFQNEFMVYLKHVVYMNLI